jgi:predicted CoA-binding protein
MNVAVLGASNKPERYSHMAVLRLQEAGHKVLPVHPTLENINGLPVYHSLADIPERIDTVTVYLQPAHSDAIAHQILQCGAKRVIFNPGAENLKLESALRGKGMLVLQACTLVLLSSRRF